MVFLLCQFDLHDLYDQNTPDFTAVDMFRNVME